MLVAVPVVQSDGPVMFEVMVMAGSLLLFAPVYGMLAVPLALLLGAWAMRFGVAGWVVAIATSLVMPGAIGAVYQALDPTSAAIGSMLLLTPVVTVHAVLLWIATRWLAPDALRLDDVA